MRAGRSVSFCTPAPTIRLRGRLRRDLRGGPSGRRQEQDMKIAQKTVLITGANRGIGEALVDEAVRRGAKRVYAGTRSGLRNADPRVTPLTLDVTNVSQIQQAVDAVESLDVLINNAGIA